MDIVLIQEGQNPVLAAIAANGAVNLVAGNRGAKSEIAHLEPDAMAALCEAWLCKFACDPNERVTINGEA